MNVGIGTAWTSEWWKVPESVSCHRRSARDGVTPGRPAAATALAGGAAQEPTLRTEHAPVITQPRGGDLALLGARAMTGIKVPLERRERMPPVAKAGIARRAARDRAVHAGGGRQGETRRGHIRRTAIREADGVHTGLIRLGDGSDRDCVTRCSPNALAQSKPK